MRDKEYLYLGGSNAELQPGLTVASTVGQPDGEEVGPEESLRPKALPASWVSLFLMLSGCIHLLGLL